jgi:L-threonylcarbamoyladenylate synthase
MPKRVRHDSNKIMNEQVTKAIDILRQGGIIVFPTDTAFGVGCRIDDETAVKKLFAIRNRPETKATPVLVDTVKMAQDYLEPIPKDVIDDLIEPYWPGALTIILPCRTDKVPGLVRGGGDTLGVRIPKHATARAIIRGLGIPVLGPSANFAGGKTPYAFEELDSAFIKQVDFVVSGECTIKQASTVIDCTVSPWKIVREGGVSLLSLRGA